MRHGRTVSLSTWVQTCCCWPAAAHMSSHITHSVMWVRILPGDVLAATRPGFINTAASFSMHNHFLKSMIFCLAAHDPYSQGDGRNGVKSFALRTQCLER